MKRPQPRILVSPGLVTLPRQCRIVVNAEDGQDADWKRHGRPHFLTRTAYERLKHGRKKP